MQSAKPAEVHVLIETLWNVKIVTLYNNEEEMSGINRNIVECKDD